MSFTVIREGQRIARQLEGRRTLAETLTGEEYERVQAGDLVPFTETGGLMSLDSPLTEGQIVVLRQLEPGDLAGFGRRDPASGRKTLMTREDFYKRCDEGRLRLGCVVRRPGLPGENTTPRVCGLDANRVNQASWYSAEGRPCTGPVLAIPAIDLAAFSDSDRWCIEAFIFDREKP